jgi:site-specific recombinase XerD
MLNAGIPASTVQIILGHKYIETTLGYSHLLEETVAEELHHLCTK